MPITAKLALSLVIVAISIGLVAVKANANNAGPDWLWRGGKRDAVRSLLTNPDGSMRRFAKPAALVFFALVLLALWVIVPTVRS